MDCPFPGMDPYLEDPALWSNPHNSLVVAIADAISPRIRPRYYAALGRRTYALTDDLDDRFGRPTPSPVAIVVDRVDETFVEIRQAGTHRLVTIVEVLSHPTKLDDEWLRIYEAKRIQILASDASLVEIDLLRDGEPLPLLRTTEKSDYRILVSRSWRRPRAKLYAFSVRAAIPTFPLPLLEGTTRSRST